MSVNMIHPNQCQADLNQLISQYGIRNVLSALATKIRRQRRHAEELLIFRLTEEQKDLLSDRILQADILLEALPKYANHIKE